VNIYHRDGGEGLPEKAPFDKIIVTCAAPIVPGPLKAQLNEGGRLVIPVGPGFNQEMMIIKKKEDKFIDESLGMFVFVPLTGKFGVK
jgi:protein-L-isoaspartate(D-aspartate) O-methyltransferase